jgi:hypothetical protein
MLSALGIADLFFSFQLVRVSKYMIVGLYISLALFLSFMVSTRVASRFRMDAGVLAGFVLISLLAKLYPERLPFLNFDFFRGQVPDAFTQRPYLPYAYKHEDNCVQWIRENTRKDATVYGLAGMRAGALRSMPFDYKGASMLIEENKERYMDWARKNRKFEHLGTMEERFSFLKELGVDYAVTNPDSSAVFPMVYQSGGWRIYKLR